MTGTLSLIGETGVTKELILKRRHADEESFLFHLFLKANKTGLAAVTCFPSVSILRNKLSRLLQSPNSEHGDQLRLLVTRLTNTHTAYTNTEQDAAFPTVLKREI